MKFILNNDIDKIIKGEFEFYRLADNSFMLTKRFKERIIEIIVLTQDEWKTVWEMLTEE